jgi:hypothetical protein
MTGANMAKYVPLHPSLIPLVKIQKGYFLTEFHLFAYKM